MAYAGKGSLVQRATSFLHNPLKNEYKFISLVGEEAEATRGSIEASTWAVTKLHYMTSVSELSSESCVVCLPISFWFTTEELMK